MPCKVMSNVDCLTAQHYLKQGRGNYNGEKCLGCLFWEDTPADIEFKLWVCANLTLTHDYAGWLEKLRAGGTQLPYQVERRLSDYKRSHVLEARA